MKSHSAKINKNYLIVILIIVVVAIVGGSIYWFLENLQKPFGIFIDKEDFSIRIPDNWKEREAVAGLKMMAIRSEEIITASDKKTGFSEYISVGNDLLGGKSFENYINTFKGSIGQITEDNKVVSEKSEKIKNYNADFIEFKIKPAEGLLINNLSVLVKGDNDDVWILSFNSTSNTWEQYKDSFYQSARSFLINK